MIPAKYIITSNSITGLCFGAGLYYATSKGMYHHYPMIVLCPSAYCGYHIFKNRDTIINYVKTNVENEQK